MRSGTELSLFLRIFLPTQLPAQLGQLNTGQAGRRVLQSRLWCPDGLERLLDK